MNIVIIGAGFSGAMIAVHLMRQVHPGTQIVFMERRGRFAEGVAYSTRQDCHLLNVPAGRMSAFPDDEEHFLRWAACRQPEITGGTFLPRRLYAEYLRDILAEAEAAQIGMVQRVNAEAVALRQAIDTEGLVVIDQFGRSRFAHAVVLAIGNYPPSDPPCQTPDFYASRLYRSDPWHPDALDKLNPSDNVLLLGTGLTMIDVAISLRERGHYGLIHAVSRRGLLPQTHRESPAAPPYRDPPNALDRWPRTALGLLRGLREAVSDGQGNGTDWREVVTSLRSVTQALWRSLPSDDRSKFLHHIRPYWETHRHRTAPAIGRAIQQMREENRLVVFAGRLAEYRESSEFVDAMVRLRGSGENRAFKVSRVINCTGPETDLARVKDPLIHSLRESGMIRPDKLGLGLDSDDSGHVIDAEGCVQPRLFLAGPLRRGLLWENIAVPELREDARRIADSVVGIVHCK